jgi:hypothetical protein
MIATWAVFTVKKLPRIRVKAMMAAIASRTTNTTSI